MHLIPIIISYVNILMKQCTDILYKILSYIFNYCYDTVKSYFVGNILCRIKVVENTELYNFAISNVFTDKIRPDTQQISSLMYVSNTIDDKVDKGKNYYDIEDKTVMINLNYGGDALFTSK